MQLASSKRCSGITSFPSHGDRRVPARPQRSTPAKQRSILARAANTEDLKGKDEDYIWTHMAFPSYLQSREKHRKDVCRDFDRAVTAAERKQLRASAGEAGSDSDSQSYWDDEEAEQSVWLSIRREAERDAAAEPLLSSFLYATILAHDSFERALAFVLSNRLANAVMLPTQLFETFYAVLTSDPDVREGALADVEACRERDPACTSYSQALLYYKGFHAIQTHRIAHAHWNRGQRVMAVALQSRMSEVLAVDIHPAARLGRGILLDHGTGVVIGETAVIGNNVSLLQNVTLGGTGKQHGDRHPKISDNVLIGASATVLGNIRVGEGAQIAAGSLVLKPVEPHTMVAGSPAKPVGTVTGNPAEKMQQWSKKLNYDPFASEQQQPAAATAVAEQQQPPRAASPSSKASVAESEAAWDAVAAKTAAEEDKQGPLASAASSSSSSTQPQQQLPLRPAVQQLAANGTSHPAAGVNGSKAPKAAAAAAEQQPAAAAAGGGEAGGAQHDHDQPRWQQSDAQQYMYEQITGHHGQQQQQQQAAEQPTEQQPPAPEQQQQQQEPPVIQGVHGGEVDATIDEAVAAVKWSGRKEEPEYVI